MRKILLFIVLALSFSGIKAQVKINFEDYVGRYIFPEGSITESAIISIVNDSILNIAASIGECNLRYSKQDVFDLPQYGGDIVFYRSEANNIEGFKISIPMAGIENLDAYKEAKNISEIHEHKDNGVDSIAAIIP